MGTDTEKFIRDLGFVAPELWATRVRMFAQEMESRAARAEAALAGLDLFMDFGTPYEPCDCCCGVKDPKGINRACEIAHGVLKRVDAKPPPELYALSPAPEPRDPNSGHGHVYPRPDGIKMRCGGPAPCKECKADEERKKREEPAPEPAAQDDCCGEVLCGHHISQHGGERMECNAKGCMCESFVPRPAHPDRLVKLEPAAQEAKGEEPPPRETLLEALTVLRDNGCEHSRGFCCRNCLAALVEEYEKPSTPPAAPEPAGALGEAIVVLRALSENVDTFGAANEALDLLSRAAAEHAEVWANHEALREALATAHRRAGGMEQERDALRAEHTEAWSAAVDEAGLICADTYNLKEKREVTLPELVRHAIRRAAGEAARNARQDNADLSAALSRAEQAEKERDEALHAKHMATLGRSEREEQAQARVRELEAQLDARPVNLPAQSEELRAKLLDLRGRIFAMGYPERSPLVADLDAALRLVPVRMVDSTRETPEVDRG